MDREYYLDNMGITRWRLRSDPKKQPEIIHELPVVWFEQKPHPTLGFFTEITNSEEQKLLMAIVQACANSETYNIGTLTDFVKSSLLFSKILIFGINQAKLLHPNFNQTGIYELSGCKILVTYALKDLLANPVHKRELWQTWQRL